MSARKRPPTERELLDAATREAHAMLKDLRIAIREADAARVRLIQEVANVVTIDVAKLVRAQGDLAAESIRGDIEQFRNEIDKRIEARLNLALFGNTQGRGEGLVIKHVVAAVERVLADARAEAIKAAIAGEQP